MMHPLIDVETLATKLKTVRLYDIRWSLTDPDHGIKTYSTGHIPGAYFVDLDKDLSGPPGSGRHPLPDVDVWSSTLGRLGVTPIDHVVAYDDAGGTIASRLWWMLRSIGHANVQVLDGGYQGWRDTGLQIEQGVNKPAAAIYPTPSGFSGVVERGALEGRLIVDARSFERYSGRHEPVDPKAGHIPGAISRPAEGNLSPTGTFLEAQNLAKRFADLGDSPVMSCGSGVTTCHNALAMVVAGMKIPDIYIGSFSEWSRLDLPVVSGDDP